MGWYGPQTGACSCCGAVVCGCSSTPSDSYSVTVQNWADNGCCEGCNEFCGTHTLTKISDCLWRKTGTIAAPCRCEEGGVPRYTDDYLIELEFVELSGNLKVTCTISYCYDSGLGGFRVGIIYSKLFSGNPDCTAFTNEAIPHSSHFADVFDYCSYGVTIDDLLLTAL